PSVGREVSLMRGSDLRQHRLRDVIGASSPPIGYVVRRNAQERLRRRCPRGHVDRQDAEISRYEIGEVPPELWLRDRGETPQSIHVLRVRAQQPQILIEEVLNAGQMTKRPARQRLDQLDVEIALGEVSQCLEVARRRGGAAQE